MIFSFLQQVQVYTLLSVLENPWEIHQLFLLTSGYVGYHIGCGANATCLDGMSPALSPGDLTGNAVPNRRFHSGVDVIVVMTELIYAPSAHYELVADVRTVTL